MNNIAVITTFPNNMWDVYAKQALESFVKYWPKEIELLIQLDDDLLLQDVSKLLRPTDAIAVGWEKDHAEFVMRNKDKDHPTDYRKQAVRFCHKVFAIKRVLDAYIDAKNKKLPTPRYLIWMDADVITTRPVTMDEIKECLPKEGDAVAYLGRKDWDHSECGWLAFDLENSGEQLIKTVVRDYETDAVLQAEQIHDSWIWDSFMKDPLCFAATNLTDGKPGREIWKHSPMSKWSTHYKGPQAKQELFNQKKPMKAPKSILSNLIINTRNAIPDESIRAHIEKNQVLIKNWIQPCKKNNETVVVVSAGPMLIAEDVRKEVEVGHKIVAVKHALTPLKKAGITPWACILLDPRPHVADFIKEADPSVIWLVASQVNPAVTAELLARGCTVWGYHANVNAGEEKLITKQEGAIISGGSATATRGLFLLNQLGFSSFKLYGYDLCVPDKPDLDAVDESGQPKFLEISVGMNDPLYSLKRLFFSEPQLIAQFEELNEIIKLDKFNIDAYGDGIVPFMLRAKKTADLRRKEIQARITTLNPPTLEELLGAGTSTTRSATGDRCPDTAGAGAAIRDGGRELQSGRGSRSGTRKRGRPRNS